MIWVGRMGWNEKSFKCLGVREQPLEVHAEHARRELSL